jgi:TrmH family RNA methyltransferase
MGALFAVPLARVGRVAAEPGASDGELPRVDAVELVAGLPGTTVALDAHGGEPLADAVAAVDGPLTLVVGAERAGLPADVVAACDRVARIPIASESLNAAMAATVALYEVTRGAVAAEHRMPPA